MATVPEGVGRICAEKVRDELNLAGQAWAGLFTAVQAWAPRPPAQSLRDLRVYVNTGRNRQILSTRNWRQRSIEVAIHFLQGTTDPTVINNNVDIVECVADYFLVNATDESPRLIGGFATVTGVEIFPIVSPVDLDKNQLFYSMLTVTVMPGEEVY